MVIRHRAIQAEDKQERYQAILDAAERLLLRSPGKFANVAEVADEAGLAKGTVYLYFSSKEELLLAVHERKIDVFFNALIDRLAMASPVEIADVLALAHRYMVEPPLFLPLAARCIGMMSQSVPAEIHSAFKQRMADRLQRAGAGLERHFDELDSGAGVSMLRYSYALIIGLWQMSSASGGHCPVTAGDEPSLLAFSYGAELDRALRSLWKGTIGCPLEDTSRTAAETQ